MFSPNIKEREKNKMIYVIQESNNSLFKLYKSFKLITFFRFSFEKQRDILKQSTNILIVDKSMFIADINRISYNILNDFVSEVRTQMLNILFCSEIEQVEYEGKAYKNLTYNKLGNIIIDAGIYNQSFKVYFKDSFLKTFVFKPEMSKTITKFFFAQSCNFLKPLV